MPRTFSSIFFFLLLLFSLIHTLDIHNIIIIAMSDATPSRTGDAVSPKVMIVGAGLSGLLLGILLEKTGTQYRIYERADTVKPLGALMSLGANVMSILVQPGLYEKLLEISYPVYKFNFYNGKDMSRIGNLGGEDNYKL